MELKENSYDIIIENNALSHLSDYIKEVYHNSKIYIITDDFVAPYYLNMVKDALSKDYIVESVIFPHGEASKSISNYCHVVEELLNKNIRRNELLLALGGGVTGDLTGFIASSLFRGLPYVSVPTSLLSQMDSSIGGKTGIDFASRKNILGAFIQPKLVVIDPLVLKTLPKEEWNNGMGELIKHAVIGNQGLFKLLKENVSIDENIIYESLSVKKRVVELDPYDLKERMLLNFGHTFGHIVELERNLRHGEAVGLGMLMAIELGIDLHLTKPECLKEVEEVLKNYQLPHQIFSYKDYLERVALDKKNLAGLLKFVLIKDIGDAFLYPIEEKKLKELSK